MLKSSDMGWYGVPPSQNLSHDIPSTKGESNALETDRFVFSFKFKLNTKLYKVKRMPPAARNALLVFPKLLYNRPLWAWFIIVI